MKKLSLAILTLLVTLAACKKVPEVNLKYVDVERDLITVGMTTATVQCDYQYIATLKKAYFYYGEGEDEVDMNAAEMRVLQNTLYVDLIGLKESTTYSYYYEFYNGFNSMRSAVKTFKTEGSGITITLPTVVTAEVTEITTNSAKSGGEVTNDGGAEVTERGICWGTNANPTLSDSHIAAGTGIGAFVAMMNGLEVNTTYHVRAYATNEVGTAYGLDREFVTTGSGSGVPEGAIDGLFSVSPTQKVYFSQGNLQYQASTNTWRFAEHQWDFVGGVYSVGSGEDLGNVYENETKCDNMLASASYTGWIDMFSWGTSGWNCGNTYYRPYDMGGEGEQYGPIGITTLTGQYANSDWGVYNPIINGGNQPGIWRTMTMEEWNYIMQNREHAEEKFAFASVNGIHGCILLPDEWICPVGLSFVPQVKDWTTNVYTVDQWLSMESNGAAFLPASGWRYPGGMGEDDYCIYQTVDSGTDFGNISFFIHGIVGYIPSPGHSRNIARAVRLIQDGSPHISITVPNVATSEVTSITSNSATCGGEVTDDGGATVTECGICWSTDANPTTSDSHVSAGTGTGSFSATMSDLQANTTYHVRAYATNEAGTGYGEDKEFTTLSGGGGSGAPEGAINGLFTINANGDQVYFSQGNLQYQASTNTWRFAEHQWDYVGGITNAYPFYGEALGTVYENGVKSNNNDISSSYSGWIDLFGWGTSGWDCGNTYYRPWDSDDSNGSLYGPPNSNNLTGSYVNSDWGYYNPISNGGNQSHKWRTLTRQEWHYVLFTRSTPSNIHFAKAIVNEVNGVILLPDTWNTNYFALNDPDVRNVSFSCNVIDLTKWYTLEYYGAVFLPAAGSRRALSLSNILSGGNYSSASFSSNDSNSAGGVGFSAFNIDTSNGHRYNGISVRLVQSAQ